MTATKAPRIDRNQIATCLGMADQRARIEIRSLNKPILSKTAAATGAGISDLADTAARWARDGRNVYWCLNPVRDDYRDGKGRAVKDADIVRRTRLLLDGDSIRDDGDAPATDGEAEAARRGLLQAVAMLRDHFGFPSPMLVVDSGNGCQAIYKVDLDIDPGTNDLVRRFLTSVPKLMGPLFGGCQIDPIVSNLSRLARLPGTVNHKPNASDERPARPTYIIGITSRPGIATEAMLREVVEVADQLDAQGKASPDPAGDGIWVDGEHHAGMRATSGEAAYVRKALAGECDKIRGTTPGGRHAQIRSSAIAIGGFIHLEEVPREEMMTALVAAAVATGKTEEEASKVVSWGLDRGAEKPRNLPEPKAEANGKAHGHGAATSEASESQGGGVDYKGLTDTDMGIVRGSTVRPRAIRWAWKYRAARGKIAMIAGDGGKGKTMLLLWMAAATSRGWAWPDGSGHAPLGTAVILSAEDSAEDTLAPRLIAMGADMDRIIFQRARVAVPREGKKPLVHPRSLQDLDYWNHNFDRYGDCRLFAVDGLPGYLGRGVNDSKNNEVRAVVETFQSEIVEPRDVSMIAATHLNKAIDATTPAHRILGSVAYVNLPRNVHIVVADPDTPGRRFFKQIKCNNAPDDLPALAFRSEVKHIEGDDGEDIECIVPVFEDAPVDVDLGSAMGKKRGPEPAKTEERARWLVDRLRPEVGGVRLGAIIQAAGEAGLIGKQKPDGKWSNTTALYDARDMVPKLDGDYSGCDVEESKHPNQRGYQITYWRLVRDSGSGQVPRDHWTMAAEGSTGDPAF